MSCNLCEQEFGHLQTYYAHVRLTNLPFPAPTIRGRRHGQLFGSQDATGNTQEVDTSASRGHQEGRQPGRRRTVAPTNLQRNQARWRSQRLDDGGGQAQSRHQVRAEVPQQDHAEGHPQGVSDDARPILDGVGHSAEALSPEADSMQEQTQT